MRDNIDVDQDPWFSISERVKAERKRSGMSRQQLAAEVGVSRGTIFNWESGRRIPVEKCAALASGLDVPTDDILSLHPEVPSLGSPIPRVPDEPDSVRFTRREITLFSVVGVGLIVGMAFLTWTTANATCTEVGAGNGTAAPQFRAAYENAGGRVLLGCAVEDVRKWGPGLSQSIDGGDLGPGSILALDRFGEAFVFSGELWESFRWISDGASTDVAGYPVTPPLQCDGSYVVGLAGGSTGPGALVQHADGASYEPITGDVWVAYRIIGGPGGPLGRPISSETDNTGNRVEFEGGSITSVYGEIPIVEPTGTSGNPLDLASCAEVPLAEAADI